MKQKVLFVLLNGYADWGAFLSTALHVAVIPDGEIKYEVHTVAPTLDTVRPIGGFRTLPDYSFENMNHVNHTGNCIDQLKKWGVQFILT